MKLMLDSGAYSAFTQGLKIDLDNYIDFCHEYPDVSCFVNLDVIPGAPGCREFLSEEEIESACKESWENYQKMLNSELPVEKVIPVFHIGESFRWLEKYLDSGAKYIGLSPTKDPGRNKQIRWLRQVKRYVLDSDGQPIVKMHLFGSTAFALLQAFPWYSADSTTYLHDSKNGVVCLPRKTEGVWDYSVRPHRIDLSTKKPPDTIPNHITNLPGPLRRRFVRYLEANGFDLKKVENSMETRILLNSNFMKQANEALAIHHVFFAGAGTGLEEKTEFGLRKRLFSFDRLQKGAEHQLFIKWIDTMKEDIEVFDVGE